MIELNNKLNWNIITLLLCLVIATGAIIGNKFIFFMPFIFILAWAVCYEFYCAGYEKCRSDKVNNDA